MTISKKLLIVASMALGLQLNTAAYFSAADLKTEITSILDFIDVLDQENTAVAQKAGQLLDKEFRNEDKYDWDRYTLKDVDIIDMARIIAMDSTIDAKATAIVAIFAQQEVAKKLQTQRRYKDNMKFLGAIIAMTAITMLPCFLYPQNNLAAAKS